MRDWRDILAECAPAARRLEVGGDSLVEGLERLAMLSRTFLASIAEGAAFVGGEAPAASLDAPPASGTGLTAALDALFAAASGGLGIATTSGRFLGYVPGGGLPSAAFGDFVAALTNRYVGFHASAPTATHLENEVTGWLRDFMGLGAKAWGTLTSGGSAANLLGILAARKRLGRLERPRATVYLTAQAHTAITRGLRIAGIEDDQLRYVATDARQRMLLSALAEAIARDAAEGWLPWLVCATAGTVNTGAVDPLAAIHEVCRRHGMWLHVDGAYGGFFRLCPETRPLLEPLALADSIALDPHKGLFMPYGIGAVLVADGSSLKEAMTAEADYLSDVQQPEARSPADFSFELTRPFRAPRVWLSMHAFGLTTFVAALSEKLALARLLHERLAALPELAMGPIPELSVVSFRVAGDDAGGTATRRLLAELLARGRVHVSSTVLDGTFVLRACVLCFRTHQEQIEAVVNEICRVLRQQEDGRR